MKAISMRLPMLPGTTSCGSWSGWLPRPVAISRSFTKVCEGGGWARLCKDLIAMSGFGGGQVWFPAQLLLTNSITRHVS